MMLVELAAKGEAAKSGPIGLAVILILCVACYFLFKSMSKHLRTVREDFPTDLTGTKQQAEPVTPSAVDRDETDNGTDATPVGDAQQGTDGAGDGPRPGRPAA